MYIYIYIYIYTCRSKYPPSSIATGATQLDPTPST